MVLNLRLIERAEYAVRSAFGSCEAFERYLNENVCWVFEQAEKRYLNAKWVEYPPSTILLGGNCKVVLARPRPSKDNFYNEIRYVILTVLTVSKDDRAEALKARELDEPIRIFDHGLLPATISAPRPVTKPVLAEASASRTTLQEPTTHAEAPVPKALKEDEDKQRFIITPKCPSCNTNLTPGRGLYCPQCNHKLPPELAVHPEVVVAIKTKDYDKLAKHLKQQLNVAWSNLLKGRKVDKTVSSMGEKIFLIAIKDENRSSSLAEEQKLDDILVDAGIGRISSDRYELKQFRNMAAKNPSMT
jgi:hypothetical protein